MTFKPSLSHTGNKSANHYTATFRWQVWIWKSVLICVLFLLPHSEDRSRT